MKELKTYANPDAKIFLIGNKADLEEKRRVEKSVAEKYSRDFDISYFTECSAKSGFNAKEVFIKASLMLFKDYLKYKTSVSG